MGTTFFQGFDRVDLYTAAAICAAVNSNQPLNAQAAFAWIEPAKIKVYPPSFIFPRAFLLTSDSYALFAVAGTTSDLQWIFHVLGSLQTTVPGVPGAVDTYFEDAAREVELAAGLDIVAAAAGRKVVYVGHSFGGAVAQVLYQKLGRQITSPTSIFTFGCPRVGDPDFAVAFGINTLSRVENDGDPIPSLPPPIWAAENSSYPIPGLPPIVSYEHAPNQNGLDLQGYLAPTNTPNPVLAIVSAIYGAQPINSHSIGEYLRRLALQFNPSNPSVAVTTVAAAANATILDPATQLNLGGPMPPATNKVSVFYEFQGDGPSEIWYSNASVADLKSTLIPAYVNARLKLATAGMSAVYGRISQVGKPRQIDFWVPGFAQNAKGKFGQIKSGGGQPPNLFPTTYIGSYSGPDVQAQQALLLRILNTGGFWTRMYLHGFPAEVIVNGKYQPTGQWLSAVQDFIKFLAVLGSGWLSQSTTPNALGNRVQITSIVANPGRGSQVTYVTPAPVTPPGWPPVVGTTVSIGGAGASQYGMNGRKRITSTLAAPATAFNVGGAAPVGAGPMAGQAYFYLDVLNSFQAQLGQVERLTTHKVGKPVFEPVGRRKNTLALRR